MSIGCCGRPTANLEALAYTADLYPRSTKAGQRARVRLALAMVERRGIAQNRPDLVAKARRGLAGLGSVASDALARGVAQVRRAGEVGSDGIATMTSSRIAAERARHSVEQQRAIDTAMELVRGVIGVARGVATSVAAQEQANAARDGRPVDATASDTTKAIGWVEWILGGAFPDGVDENDLRIFNGILNNPAVIAITDLGLAGSITAANLGNPPATGLASFLVWLKGHITRIRNATTAAVAALPPPPGAPPAPPQPELTLMQKVASMSPTARAAMQSQANAFSREMTRRTVAAIPTPKSSSSVVLALPAALVLWYLFK